ncbi:amidohydrolase family protein [Emcibacter nanhaiensis]|uniref:Amidohydrolase family protein n=1 Tax=Emcibacter nanhaiensis TaxID=1505037 RepID=A0A501PHI0_9PROT|nr:amidohydrolase family protein [Emcibacter nanhaiensis]TPD59879.1 amidohydrolase family protein [Emcibacter nanhaiensis]
MLIRNAEIYAQGVADLRLFQGRIVDIGALKPGVGEEVLEADGSALLPGLHDHHIHLAALAARRSSVLCGPPEVQNKEALAARLAEPGMGWLRGIGYHESVAGMLDAGTLDRMAGDRPVRIQHRGGRMWFLNSAALDILLAQSAPPPGLEKVTGKFTGRLFDEDGWLKQALGSTPPDFADISAELASHGVTGITDMSPANDPEMAHHFHAQQQAGRLLQHCLLAGTLKLTEAGFDDGLQLGPAKLHLHEAELPEMESVISFIQTAHEQGRPVAIHCVTETELVFALAMLEEAGTMPGDRIEHASVTPDPLLAQIARMGLRVVSQPHFIAERGDRYRQDVEVRDQPYLYRLKAFIDAGVSLAAGSDAPFGKPDPWASMAAAISRSTSDGYIMGVDEALTPEEALDLYLADPVDLARTRNIEVEAPADLCLLDRSWTEARKRLSAEYVRATIIGGSVVYDRVDQSPLQSRLRIEAFA